uniref:BCL2 interacting protein 1 n=1 Tax=Bubo bubo TaxID=30461 RepID=A0A8C0FTL4_BUBBB
MAPGEELVENAKGPLHCLPFPTFRGTEGTSCFPGFLAVILAILPAAEGQRPRLSRPVCPETVGGLSGLNRAGSEARELEQMAKEQDKESEKQALLREVENHKKQMLSNQAAWRKANLACKIAIDNSEKDQLLQGRDSLRQRKTTKESLAESASNITESLMGISRMMSQQVQQSEETVQTLANSSRTILEANEEFKSMSGTIQLGRKLITKYNRRELTDKMLIFLALALFLATVLYILKKRLFPFL